MTRVSGTVDVRTAVIVAGLSLLSTAAAAYEIAPAGVLPLVRADLAVGPTAAGWLLSVIYATAVVTSVPLGVVLDRVPIRRALLAATAGLLVAGLWGWAAGTGGSYRSLLASRALGGLSYLVFWNAGADIVRTVVGPDRRATAVGLFTASAPVGFALGQFGSPLLARLGGWPIVFPAFSALSVVGITLFLAATAGGEPSLDSDGPGPTWAQFRRVLASRAVWHLSGVACFAFALYLFLNSWVPSYLTTELAVPLSFAGPLTALVPAVGVLARAASGAVSDGVFDGRRRPVIVASFAGTVPAVGGFPWATRLAVVLVLLVVSGFAIQLAIGLVFTMIAEVVREEVTATAVSVATTGGMLGAFASPIVAGELIATVGYRATFLVAFAVASGGLLLARLAPESANY